MNETSDEKLKVFLQRYQPEAPAAQPHELTRLLSCLESRNQRRLGVGIWGRSAALAASILAVFSIFYFEKIQVMKSTTASEIGFELEEGNDLLSYELPTLEVGEEYLELANE